MNTVANKAASGLFTIGKRERSFRRITFDEGRKINAQTDQDDDLPVLTEAIAPPDVGHPRLPADELVKLQAKLSAQSLTLADQMLHDACHDVEDIIVERVMARLRSELPALVNRVLHDHFHGEE